MYNTWIIAFIFKQSEQWYTGLKSTYIWDMFSYNRQMLTWFWNCRVVLWVLLCFLLFNTLYRLLITVSVAFYDQYKVSFTILDTWPQSDRIRLREKSMPCLLSRPEDRFKLLTVSLKGNLWLLVYITERTDSPQKVGPKMWHDVLEALSKIHINVLDSLPFSPCHTK